MKTPSPQPKPKTGEVIGSNLDWLAYTVPWPFEETIIKSKISKINQFSGELYSYEQTEILRENHGRSTVGYVNLRQLQKILESALPLPVIKKLSITIDHKDKNARMKNYDIVRELHMYDKKTDTLTVIGHIGFHTRNASMGVHVVMRGDHLSALRARGIQEQKLLQLLLATGARVSRLDLALDIRTETKPFEIYQRCQTGEIQLGYRGKVKSWKFIEQDNGGSGATLGSKSSERWFRLYDKGREVDPDGDEQNWLRLEAVLRDDTAQTWAIAAAEHKINVVMKALTHSYFTGWADLNKWLSKVKSIEPITVPPKQKKSQEKWLMTVALKSVLTALTSDYDIDRSMMEIALREALSLRAVETGYRNAMVNAVAA